MKSNIKTRYSKWIINLMLLALIFSANNIAHGQNNTEPFLEKKGDIVSGQIVETVGSPSIVLTSEEAILLNKIITRPNIMSNTIVSTSSFVEKQVNGLISISIPDVSCSLVAKAQQVEFFEGSNFTWMGEFKPDNCDCVSGYVNVTSRNNKLSGSISVENRLFTLFPLKEGLGVLAEYDSLNQEYGCLLEDEGIENPIREVSYQTETRNSPITCEVDILIFFTEDADESDELDIVSQAHEFMTYTRQALLNTRIWRDQIRLNLISVEKIPDFFEVNSGDIRQDFILTFNEFNSVNNQYVQDRIDETGANIAVLLTETGFGLGVAVNPLGTQNNGPRVGVSAFSAISKVTFAHEVGHIFGCQHQRCEAFQPECDDSANERHAHRFSHKRCFFSRRKDYATLVHGGNLGGAISIANYSNPDVKFNGDVNTGIENVADNAKAIMDNRCFVATNNPNEVTYRDVNILGPNELCPYTTATFSAQILGTNNNNFSLRWETSTDGFNYTTEIFEDPLIGGAPIFPIPDLTISLPAAGNTIFIRITIIVSTPDGPQTYTDYHTITTIFDDFLCPQEITGGNSGTNVSVSQSLNPILSQQDMTTDKLKSLNVGNPFPNPAQETAMLQIYLPAATDVSVILYNVNGEVKRNIPPTLYEKGNNTINISLQNLQSGLYFVKTKVGDKIFSNKITVLK